MQEDPDPTASPHLPALEGNLSVGLEDIHAGPDLYEKSTYGPTPLIVAAAFGSTELASARQARHPIRQAQKPIGVLLEARPWEAETTSTQSAWAWGHGFPTVHDGFGVREKMSG